MKHVLLKLCATSIFATSLVYATPTKEVYDSEKIADIFYALNGDKNDPHKKVNHTKGFCAAGEFMPVNGITKNFDIPLFSEKNIPTEARFSLGGGNPKASDKSKVRGMALKINGEKDSFQVVMLNTEINFAKNPEEFGKYFEMRIPKNGKIDNEVIKKKTQEVASYRNFEAYLAKIGITPSVANTTYYSIHTFFVKDTKTKKFIPVRWKFVPVQGQKFLTQDELQKLGDDYLESDFKNKVSMKPIEYKMFLVLANPKDTINDTTALWQGKHKEIHVATLKLNKYSGHDCNPEVFMPNGLPSGIEPPKDPLFEIRNEVYGITFGRRQ